MKEKGIGRIIFTEREIQEQVSKMAKMLSLDYDGKDPILIGILNGSFYFMADLTRYMTIPLSIDFLSIGVYPEVTKNGNCPV